MPIINIKIQRKWHV